MKILILAYASEPGAGSEYGVGWMVPLTMARRYPQHEVYVLTRSRCKEKINETLNKRNGGVASYKTLRYENEYESGKKLRAESIEIRGGEQGTQRNSNLHYVFYDQPRWMTYPNEMQSRWGEQINYIVWQLMVRRKVKSLHKKIHFDVIHHLTFNQYRTPSPGFWMDVPFVMGPVGGAERIADVFWQDLEAHSLKKEKIRQKGRDLKLFRWLCRRSDNLKVLLCSSQENMNRLRPYAEGCEVRVMPAIAMESNNENENENLQYDNETQRRCYENENKYTIVYAGKALDWKGLHLFLRAASLAFHRDDRDSRTSRPYRIKLIGIRSEAEQTKVNRWVQEEGLTEHVELIPFMERSLLLKELRDCSLSVYPAFRDSGSMSVLEACALGCPVLCFDAGGQDIFPDEVLMKVPVGNTYEECVQAFAQALRKAYDHPDIAKAIGLSAQHYVTSQLTWEQRVDDFMAIYENVNENRDETLRYENVNVNENDNDNDH